MFWSTFFRFVETTKKFLLYLVDLINKLGISFLLLIVNFAWTFQQNKYNNRQRKMICQRNSTEKRHILANIN
jgi:hypothetical protein